MSNESNAQATQRPAEAGAGENGSGPIDQPPGAAPTGPSGQDPMHAALAEVRAELAETKRILDSLKQERGAPNGAAPIPSGAMSPRIAYSGASRLAAAARVASRSGDRGSLMAYLRLRRAAG